MWSEQSKSRLKYKAGQVCFPASGCDFLPCSRQSHVQLAMLHSDPLHVAAGYQSRVIRGRLSKSVAKSETDVMIWYEMMMLPAQADVPICWASLWNSVIWQRALCSWVSHSIQLSFLSSSSSVSYHLPHPLPLLLIFHFIVFHFS